MWTTIVAALNLTKWKLYAIAFGTGIVSLLLLIGAIFRVAHVYEQYTTMKDVLNQYNAEAKINAEVGNLSAAAARNELRSKWTRK